MPAQNHRHGYVSVPIIRTTARAPLILYEVEVRSETTQISGSANAPVINSQNGFLVLEHVTFDNIMLNDNPLLAVSTARDHCMISDATFTEIQRYQGDGAVFELEINPGDVFEIYSANFEACAALEGNGGAISMKLFGNGKFRFGGRGSGGGGEERKEGKEEEPLVLFSMCSAQMYSMEARGLGDCLYIVLDKYYTLPAEGGFDWKWVNFVKDEEGYGMPDGEMVYIDADGTLVERVSDLFLNVRESLKKSGNFLAVFRLSFIRVQSIDPFYVAVPFPDTGPYHTPKWVTVYHFVLLGALLLYFTMRGSRNTKAPLDDQQKLPHQLTLVSIAVMFRYLNIKTSPHISLSIMAVILFYCAYIPLLRLTFHPKEPSAPKWVVVYGISFALQYMWVGVWTLRWYSFIYLPLVILFGYLTARYRKSSHSDSICALLICAFVVSLGAIAFRANSLTETFYFVLIFFFLASVTLTETSQDNLDISQETHSIVTLFQSIASSVFFLTSYHLQHPRKSHSQVN